MSNEALEGMMRRIMNLEKRVDRLKTKEGIRLWVCTDDVSDPPTDGELDTAFGTPATVGSGFVGIVDDNNADTTLWICATNGTSWHYVAKLTKAV